MLSNPPKSALLFDRISNQTPNSKTTAATTSSTCAKQSHHLRRTPPLPSAETPIPESVARYHTHPVGPSQCCSAVIQKIDVPVSTVWSVVRRFDNPQAYKHFVKSCQVVVGNGGVGTLREVHIISGLPAANSRERLEILDDERHVISFSVVGGDHRLANYRSVTTLHPSPAGYGTVVVESYIVDVPPGNTKEETCVFIDTIVRCNLQSLAQIADNLPRQTID